MQAKFFVSQKTSKFLQPWLLHDSVIAHASNSCSMVFSFAGQRSTVSWNKVMHTRGHNQSSQLNISIWLPLDCQISQSNHWPMSSSQVTLMFNAPSQNYEMFILIQKLNVVHRRSTFNTLKKIPSTFPSAKCHWRIICLDQWCRSCKTKDNFWHDRQLMVLFLSCAIVEIVSTPDYSKMY